MPPEAILADLARRYPDGARYFAPDSGKLLTAPDIRKTPGGFWRVNVNGYFHLYDEAGAFLSKDSSFNRGLSMNRTRL